MLKFHQFLGKSDNFGGCLDDKLWMFGVSSTDL